MKPATCFDVMFIHVHKQHIYEPIAGAVGEGLKTAFATPLYNGGLTRLIFGYAPGPVGGNVRQHADPRLSAAAIKTNVFWAFGRLFVNYAWHGGESRFFRLFDRWCAAAIRAGRFKAKIFYVFQDYLPLTSAAAKEAGSLLVAEQILNNSSAAQQRVIESTQKVRFPVQCPEYPLDQSANERLLRLADRVVVPSSYVRRDIEREVPAERIWQIPYSAEAPSAPKARRNEGRLVVAVWASSVRKGGHLLLEALMEHPAEELFPGYEGEVEFLLLGNLDPQFMPALGRIQSLSPRVKITHGYIPHAEVHRRLTEADFFICPSLSEGMSLAILEAAGTGLPLVITPYCGVDAFVSGTHGILIEESTPDGVARAIRRMFELRGEWERFGRNARNIVQAHPWSSFQRQIGSRLRSLIQ